MPTKLYFRSEVYSSAKSFPKQQPGMTTTVASAADGGVAGTGIVGSAANNPFGVIGHDLAYNPNTGRWLMVGDAGGASLFATWCAWADNIEGPWTRSTGVFDNTTTYSLIGCVFAFGQFFVLDNTNGRVWSSPTGESGTWTLAYTPTTLSPGKTLNFINGRIVSCMNSSILGTTTDGVNWTTITLPGGGVIAYDIDYSAAQNLWVVAGGSATVWYSSDFITWVRVNLQGQSDSTRAIYYSDKLGLWVVCGNTGFISTTPDPTSSSTWTTRTSGTTQILISIVSDGSNFLIVGDLKTVIRSSDLATWTITQFTTDSSDFWQAKYINGNYYIVGERSPNLIWGTDDNGVSLKIYGSHKSRRVVQPGLLANFGKPVMTEDAMQLRTMSLTPGTAQVAATFYSANTLLEQTGLLGRFASNPIANESVVIGAGSIILNSADANNGNTRMQFSANSVNIYVWRPSTNSLVGYILDGAGFAFSTKPYLATENVTHITGILGAPVTAIEGDIVVVEVWTTLTQTTANYYQGTWYYNGTTENNTNAAAVSNHASYIQFTEDILFKTGRASFHAYTSV